MNGIYQYSLLKYIHSRFLGEEVNIGILFYFPATDEIIFRFPKNLERLKHLYKDFPEKLVKSYLVSFEKAALKFSTGKHLFAKERRLEDILPDYFIVPDGSALAFEDVKSGVQYNGVDKTTNDLYNRYFAPYITGIGTPEIRRDERYIVHTFHHLLKSKDENIVHYLRGEKKVKTPKALLRIDEHWKNGTINLVKAVSFDLKEEGDILHKAAQLFGTLNFLGDELKRGNYKCDFIFSAPQNPKLRDAYQNAVEIIESADGKKETYTDINIETYVNKLVKEVKRTSLEEDTLPF